MNKKRLTLRKMVLTGGVAFTLPHNWSRPLVKSLVLPAHAQTSSELVIDDISSKVINRNTPVFVAATGSIGWAVFDVAFLTGKNLDENTSLTLHGDTEKFNSNAAPIAEMRVLPNSEPFGKTTGPIIYIWTNFTSTSAFLPTTNGLYVIELRAKNPNGPIVSKTFELLIEGFI